jgi:signal transduction histidine kinase/class 3 adenylate cyclase/CheY-like chemotaxis protein
MTELLSKDHTILERPFMEFRPFGVDERGEKIRDVNGATVQANIDYLQETVARAAGPEAGERAVRDLSRLLNERLRDPAYHVTSDFLRGAWNSYSAEFVAYLREFCEQLSGDPEFSLKVGRERHISGLVRVLARPFGLAHLYATIPAYSNFFAAGAVAETVSSTDRSAVIRRRFTDRTNQQYGPYRRRCAELICQAFKGTLIATPERIHHLPPATVTDRACIANGDDWCEWEVRWAADTKRRLFLPGEAVSARPALAVSASRKSAELADSAKDDQELFPRDRTILERAGMEFRPFGTDEAGGKIDDIMGAVIAANVGHLEAHVARAQGREAVGRAVGELCRLLNTRIRDESYHVTPAMLKDTWRSYSAEFLCFVREFCTQLSGDPEFAYRAARERHITPLLYAVARPFSVPTMYRQYPFFSSMLGKGTGVCEVVAVTDRSATLRRKFTDRTYRQFGPYRKRCAELACQAVKGTLTAATERIHRLPPATVTDRACIANGDDWCEWEVSWQLQAKSPRAWPFWGLTAGGLAAAGLHGFYLDIAWPAVLSTALLPPLVEWMVSRGQLKAYAQSREMLIQEQIEFIQARYEELREAYLVQEQTQVELRRKINEQIVLQRQIEELNVGLEAKVRERTAELERLNAALQSANEQLHEIDRLKSEFFANVSHEFRTPLTLTMGTFKTLLKLSSAARTKTVIETGLRNTSRLLFLINEFLDLAKFDSGSMALRKQCIDLAALVRAVASNFESAEWRRVHFRGASAPVPVEADLGQMKKVLYNLLSNAFKFSDPDKGGVWIRLASKGDQVVLEVEDNGIGIPRDQLGRIFERFVQVERRATRRHEGTGIGLALVREIVTLHGGTITVESEPGRGSTFIITLPRGAATADAIVKVEDDESVVLPVASGHTSERMADVAEALEAGSRRPLVLVVDDNADMRGYLARLLSNHYRIILARDGVEGMQQAAAFHPDLILTDLMMPRMSGDDLLKAVRGDDELCTTPVVFLTARTGSEVQVKSLEAGADDYIAKPFDENEILARVGKLIRLRAQERKLATLQKEKMARFLPTQLADIIFSNRAEDVLKSHRAEITVVFIDLRGFTAFAETGEPEDVITVLHEYQAAMGRLIAEYHGLIERFSGDAIMIFFNDPVPVPDHAEQAVRLALAMRDGVVKLKHKWGQRGIDLGAGIGVATGYATLGLVGFEQRKDYAAIGAVTNLAARLCGEARHGQILISERVRHFVKDLVHAESVGAVALKGFQKPVQAYNVAGLASGHPPASAWKSKPQKKR